MQILEHHGSAAVMADQSAQGMQPYRQKSAIPQLSPQKAQHYLQRTMNERIHDITNGPSSSNSNLLTSLLALKDRGYRNVQNSDLVLSYNGGLLGGGGKRVDAASSSSSNLRNLSTADLQTEMNRVSAIVDHYARTLQNIPLGQDRDAERNETLQLYNASWNRWRAYRDEYARRL